MKYEEDEDFDFSPPKTVKKSEWYSCQRRSGILQKVLNISMSIRWKKKSFMIELLTEGVHQLFHQFYQDLLKSVNPQ